MMAFERTPSSSSLEPDTLDALRRVLAQSARRGNHADELRSVLARAAGEARDKGIHAEQLLLILKDVWYGLPEVATAASRDVETTLLQELITRCIREYYAA
jgi:hypothetical protein